MLPWAMIKEKKTRPAIEATVKALVTEDNYGRGKGKWNLSELITERTNESHIVLRMLEGVGNDGRPSRSVLVDSTGRPHTFRLRVLSRQACSETKDGWAINARNAMMTEDDEAERIRAYPADEKPEPGDLVKVKGNFLWNDPETGDLLLMGRRMALQSRVEAEQGRSIKPHDATYEWTEYIVDKDGCITVPYLHALQLLQKRGKRIVSPQFKRASNPNARGERIKERRITNWWFEEVFPEPETPKAKKN